MNLPILPDPQMLPGTATVIWDGDCNFCRAQVERLHAWDSNRLSYLSLHDERIKALCPELTHEQLIEQMWVVTADRSARYGGADAARYLSRQLPKLWWLFPLLHFPLTMPFWRWCYRQVAKRRYRISGKNCETGSCRIP
jgi:predicted DCC family thiol-disulfide oxidoreductase YuxK